MHTSETATPLAAHEMRTFGTVHSAAYACISGEERAALGLVGEDPAALERYRTVGMNYIPLSKYGSSGQGPSKRCSDAEGDNPVWTGLLNISNDETGIKVSVRGSGSASFSARKR